MEVSAVDIADAPCQLHCLSVSSNSSINYSLESSHQETQRLYLLPNGSLGTVICSSCCLGQPSQLFSHLATAGINNSNVATRLLWMFLEDDGDCGESYCIRNHYKIEAIRLFLQLYLLLLLFFADLIVISWRFPSWED